MRKLFFLPLFMALFAMVGFGASNSPGSNLDAGASGIQSLPDVVYGIVQDKDPEAGILYLGFDPAGSDQVPVQVTDDTLIMSESGEMTFEEIEVGMMADAFGEWAVGNVFVAVEIYVYDEYVPPIDYVFGEIVEIDAATKILYLGNLFGIKDGDLIPVQVTDDTLIMGESGEMTFEEIEVGMMADAFGEWTEDDLFVAAELYLYEEMIPPEDWVFGVIEEIDTAAKILYLGNPFGFKDGDLIPVQVTDDTLIIGESGEITFEEIEVGMMADAFGEWTEDDLFVASELYVFSGQIPPEDYVFGEVVEIDAAAKILYLGNLFGIKDGDLIPVQVTDDTLIIGESGEMTFEEIEVGMMADAFGEWTEDDLFVAAELYLYEEIIPPEDWVFGVIEEIDTAAKILYLGNPFGFKDGDLIPVQVTDDTLIIGESGEITFEEIEVGMMADAFGEWTDDDLFVASELYVFSGQIPPGDWVFGVVEEIDAETKILYLAGNFFGVMGDDDLIPVQVTEDTVIMGDLGPMTFDEIEVGMLADAFGEWTDENLFIAEELYIIGCNPFGNQSFSLME